MKCFPMFLILLISFHIKKSWRVCNSKHKDATDSSLLHRMISEYLSEASIYLNAFGFCRLCTVSSYFVYLLRGRGFKSRGGRGGRMSRGGMRGGVGRGMIKGFGPPGFGRGRGKDGAMNGFAPMRYGHLKYT